MRSGGEEYLAVTPAGDLYPCHQLIGDKALLMGNVSRKDFNTLGQDVFRRRGGHWAMNAAHAGPVIIVEEDVVRPRSWSMESSAVHTGWNVPCRKSVSSVLFI